MGMLNEFEDAPFCLTSPSKVLEKEQIGIGNIKGRLDQN